MAGIAAGDALFFNPPTPLPFGWLVTTWAALGLIVATLLLVVTHNIKRYLPHGIFGAVSIASFFLLGVYLCTARLAHTTHDFGTKPLVYKALITGNPEVKERSILCQATLVEGYDTAAFTIGKRVLLYFAQDSAAATLKRGSQLLVRTRPTLPANNGNPDEFDYPRYLVRKGISATGFVAAGEWSITPRTTPPGLQERALACRDAVLNLYRRLGFEGERFAVISALTMGYKEELDEDIRRSFSVSGAAHVLALSGLHVGLITAVLLFVLRRLPGRSRAVGVAQSVVVVLTLWVFAFVVGLSPSIIRSVSMFSCITLASATSRRVLTLQSLGTSAFLMLLFNPAWLFEVGFQLSYVAVLGIVIFRSRFAALLAEQGKAKRYVYNLLYVSVAAQMATAPLLAYYFSQFSTHFLLTNLLVIPLVTLIIYGTLAMWVLTPLPAVQQFVAHGVQLLVQWLNEVARRVEQLPHSSINGLWLHGTDVVCLYLLIFALAYFIYKPKAKACTALLASVLVLLCNGLWLRHDTGGVNRIAFYNIKNSPAVHCIPAHSHHSRLIYADSLPANHRIEKTMAKHWNRLSLNTPQTMTMGTNHAEGGIRLMDNMITFGGRRVCVLNDNRLNNQTTLHPLRTDYLYVCSGFTGSLTEVCPLFAPRHIVLDASLSARRREQLANECRRLNIAHTRLWEKAFIVSFR